MAVVGLVEPEPVAARRPAPMSTARALGGAARGPLADRSLGIDLDDPGMIGVGAVDEHLHLGIAELQIAGEVGPERGRCRPPGGAQHQFLGRRHRGSSCGIEIGRQLEAGGQVGRIGRRVFQDDGDRHVLHIQRQPVAEQQDQQSPAARRRWRCCWDRGTSGGLPSAPAPGATQFGEPGGC